MPVGIAFNVFITKEIRPPLLPYYVMCNFFDFSFYIFRIHSQTYPNQNAFHIDSKDPSLNARNVNRNSINFIVMHIHFGEV